MKINAFKSKPVMLVNNKSAVGTKMLFLFGLSKKVRNICARDGFSSIPFSVSQFTWDGAQGEVSTIIKHYSIFSFLH